MEHQEILMLSNQNGMWSHWLETETTEHVQQSRTIDFHIYLCTLELFGLVMALDGRLVRHVILCVSPLQILCCWNLYCSELPAWKGHHLPRSEAGQRSLGPWRTHQAHRLWHVQSKTCIDLSVDCVDSWSRFINNAVDLYWLDLTRPWSSFFFIQSRHTFHTASFISAITVLSFALSPSCLPPFLIIHNN